MVRFPTLVVPFQVAEIVAGVEAVTAATVIANVAEVAPAGTVTDAGTAALGLDEERATTAPSGGAGLFRTILLLLKVAAPVADALYTVTELMPRLN